MRPESGARTSTLCSFCGCRPPMGLYSRVRSRVWLAGSRWFGHPGVTCKLRLGLPKNFSQKKNWRATNWPHGTPNHPHLSCLPGAVPQRWRNSPKGPGLVSPSRALVVKGSVQSSVWQEHGSEQAVRAAPSLGMGKTPAPWCLFLILQVGAHRAWHWSSVEGAALRKHRAFAVGPRAASTDLPAQGQSRLPERWDATGKGSVSFT